MANAEVIIKVNVIDHPGCHCAECFGRHPGPLCPSSDEADMRGYERVLIFPANYCEPGKDGRLSVIEFVRAQFRCATVVPIDIEVVLMRPVIGQAMRVNVYCLIQVHCTDDDILEEIADELDDQDDDQLNALFDVEEQENANEL